MYNLLRYLLVFCFCLVVSEMYLGEFFHEVSTGFIYLLERHCYPS